MITPTPYAVPLRASNGNWRTRLTHTPIHHRCLNNRAGRRRHLHETPGEWEDIKLIKRLGPDATQIKQSGGGADPVAQRRG